jgi:hypothetical protein
MATLFRGSEFIYDDFEDQLIPHLKQKHSLVLTWTTKAFEATEKEIKQ